MIPGSPIAYWASNSVFDAFSKGSSMSAFGRTSKGLITGDNTTFLRLWWECGSSNTISYATDYRETLNRKNRWFACTKGGPFRRWSGNVEWVVDWRGNGETVRLSAERDGHHCQDYQNDLKFKPAIAWSAVSSDAPSFRYTEGTLSEHAGMCDYIAGERLNYMLALMNSSVTRHILNLIAPTLNFNAGDIDSLPVIESSKRSSHINQLTKDCIDLSDADWNSNETAFGFIKHPLL